MDVNKKIKMAINKVYSNSEIELIIIISATLTMIVMNCLRVFIRYTAEVNNMFLLSVYLLLLAESSSPIAKDYVSGYGKTFSVLPVTKKQFYGYMFRRNIVIYATLSLAIISYSCVILVTRTSEYNVITVALGLISAYVYIIASFFSRYLNRKNARVCMIVVIAMYIFFIVENAFMVFTGFASKPLIYNSLNIGMAADVFMTLSAVVGALIVPVMLIIYRRYFGKTAGDSWEI